MRRHHKDDGAVKFEWHNIRKDISVDIWAKCKERLGGDPCYICVGGVTHVALMNTKWMLNQCFNLWEFVFTLVKLSWQLPFPFSGLIFGVCETKHIYKEKKNYWENCGRKYIKNFGKMSRKRRLKKF